MTLALPALRPASYASSPLHSSERVWSQSNCYVDLWIEVLHSLGLDPRAAGAFTLSADFEGDQWAFFKPPVEDLRALCGIDVAELNVWRPLVDHIGEQLDFGRLLTVEVDAFHLPDTVGVSYRTEHVKTTIAPAWIEQNARQLRYFHNAGLHELEGEDFDALIGTRCAGPHALAPYVEIIKLDRLCRDEGRLAAVAGELIRSHIGRRAVDNPVRRMNKRISADLDWLRGADVETFHTEGESPIRSEAADRTSRLGQLSFVHRVIPTWGLTYSRVITALNAGRRDSKRRPNGRDVARTAAHRHRTAMTRPTSMTPKPTPKFHPLRSFMMGTLWPAR